MFQLIKTKEEIAFQLGEVEFVNKTCSQINKDLLGLSNIDLVYNESVRKNPLNGISNQLVAILIALSKSEKLHQFIYKVDLPESEYLRDLQENDWDNLTFSILRREAQKVYLKMKFST